MDREMSTLPPYDVELYTAIVISFFHGDLLTKSQVITLPEHSRKNRAMNQSEFQTNACNWRYARENACKRVTIGFGFASYWLMWCEFSGDDSYNLLPDLF